MTQYQKAQVGNPTGDIAPFSWASAMISIAGDSVAQNIGNNLVQQFLPPEYVQFLGSGELTKEQLRLLRDTLSQKVDESLGPLNELIKLDKKLTPDFIEKWEGRFQDYINGAIGDEMMDAAGNIEVPEFLGDFCEA